MQDLYSKLSEGLDELMIRVEKEYGIEIQDVRHVDHRLVIYSNIGPLLIDKEELETHVMYITGLYDYIQGSFENVVKIHPSGSGKYYTGTVGDLIIVKDYVEGKNNSFSYEGNEKEFIKLLARFHRACEGYTPPTGGKGKTDWGRWTEKYKKECRALKKYVCSIKGIESKSRFQKELLKRFNIYIEKMEESINILKGGRYLNIVEESMKRKQICIGSFKPSNYIWTGKGIYIKSLNKCRYDIVERDIADFLQKLVEYSGKEAAFLVPQLLKLYNDENPLYKDSIDVIKAFLLYPDDYEKVCSRFYKGKDKWTEDIYVDKLHETMDFEEEKMDLIHVLEDMRLY